MKVLLTGSTGQLGQAIINSKPLGIDLITTTRAQLDLSKAESCRDSILRNKPDWVINAGAYTAVDKAESEEALAMAINGEAPKVLSEALKEINGKILQISTDFVFNGSQNYPYKPNQATEPISVYGRSKEMGELAIKDILKDTNKGFILRTSWVMGPTGKNFARTMIKLHKERECIYVVDDQISCPTSTFTLAEACWRIIKISTNNKNHNKLPPIMHWCDEGIATWYDVAVMVGEVAEEIGLINKQANIIPIKTVDYPTAAKRPSYSLLDCVATRASLDISVLNWRESLHKVLMRMTSQTK